MKEFVIRLRSVRDVQDFVDLATTRSFDVMVRDDHIQVNGKSFMEMFCLNFSHRLVTESECDQGEFEQFRKEAQRFLVND